MTSVVRVGVSARQQQQPDGSVLVSVDAAMRGAVPGENGTLVASFLNDTTGWNASMPVRVAGAGEHIATLQACPASLLCT